MESPTVRRRRLGNRLKLARLATGLTGSQAAARLEISQSKVSRIESGAVPVRPKELREILNLYGITGPERADLVELGDDDGERGWWAKYGLARGYASFIGFEAEAQWVSSWTPVIVPGHLQTEAYMRAVMAVVGHLALADADKAIEVRLERQRRLAASAPTIRALLDESVLWRVVGDAKVMVEQYQRLIDSPATVRILPYERGAEAVNFGSFTILGYPDMEPVVWGESPTGDVSMELERPEKCVAAFDLLWERALNSGETDKALRDALERSA